MLTEIALALICVFLIGWIATRRTSKPTYHSKPLLTANEREFLTRLEKACPEFRFHAQVAMGAILTTKVKQGERSREWYKARNAFCQKIIDFVAEDRATGKLIAIIELDDRTHDAARDTARDALLNAAGYKTIRWQSSKRPTVDSIRRSLTQPRSSKRSQSS